MNEVSVASSSRRVARPTMTKSRSSVKEAIGDNRGVEGSEYGTEATIVTRSGEAFTY